jgi:heme/copper-type cytochrome/quinol oxidase subunit 4
MFATVVSWVLGTSHGIHDRTLASIAILIIAFVKVRFVGLYFMELREAPNPLRALFETYCVVACTIVVAVFVFA